MADEKGRAVAMRPPMPQLQRKMMQPRSGGFGGEGTGAVWEASGIGGQAPNSMWPAGMPLFPWEKVTGIKEAPEGQRIVRRDNPWSE